FRQWFEIIRIVLQVAANIVPRRRRGSRRLERFPTGGAGFQMPLEALGDVRRQISGQAGVDQFDGAIACKRHHASSPKVSGTASESLSASSGRTTSCSRRMTLLRAV